MKFYCSLVFLVTMSFVACDGQQVTASTQTVTTVSRGGTRSERTRQIKISTKQAVKTANPKSVAVTRVVASSATSMAAFAKAGGKKLHPNVLPGFPNVAVDAQNFGSVAVGGSTSMTLTYALQSGVTSLSGSFANGLDFSGANSVCTATQCSATFTFTPRYPGVSRDALITKDQNGNPVYETYLYGTGTAPQLGFDLGDLSVINGFTNQPDSVAVGPDGNYYVTDASQNTVSKYSTGDGSKEQLTIAGLGTPGGIAVDGADTVYVTDKSNNVIVAYNESLGMQTTVSLISALSNPTGIAVDALGNLYVADTGNRRIVKIDIQGNETTFASNISSPTSIAVDGQGDVFYVDGGNGGEVTRQPSDGGPVSLGTQLGTLYDIAVDAGGRVYISTPSGDTLISPDGTMVEYGGGTNYGMAVDLAGNVITTQPGSSSIALTKRSASNFILTTQVGTTTSGGDTISNTGNTPLTLSNVAVSGSTFTEDDSSQCVNGSIVQPGQTCQLVVDFSPPTAQNYMGTYTATSNSLNVTTSSNVDVLSGNGTGVPTATTLSINPNPAPPGQTVELIGTVQRTGTGISGTTNGSMTFYDGTTPLGTVSQANGASYAMYFTSTLAAGVHSITAAYSGDSINGSSTSAAQSLLVTAGNGSATTLTSTPFAPRVGQPVTFSIMVSANPAQTPVPTGTVTLTNTAVSPAAVLGTVTLNGNGAATFVYSGLPQGNASVVATYSGDANYGSSTSGADTISVLPGAITTITSLTVAPATVAYETPVTFTAMVSSGDSNLGQGQVFFCDAAAPICNLYSNLGLAQISMSTVSATLKLAPGTIGTHSFTATFVPTSSFKASTSTAQTVTVTGKYPTSTAIAATGTGGNYSLTGTALGIGSKTLSPTGTVAFVDTSNSNSVLATATLGAGTLGFSAVQPTGSPNAVGGNPYAVATGDFNGDGFADVVVGNYGEGTVSVLLGNGDGTFQTQVKYSVGGEPERVLVADFNGDGFLDLVVANTASSTISILLGNGDGTFQTQVTYPCASPVGLGVMDINRDGIPDIVAGDYYASTMSVLLGYGDGTFQTAVTYPTGSTPQTVAEGDFNGDGNVDVVVGNEGGGTVGIFLGNGDGTFQTMVTYAVGSGPQGVQVGDFNGDGRQDLAVANHEDGTISILLGNGDGTFQGQVTYPVGSQPVGLVIADFNGDGLQDIAVNNTAQSSLSQSILLGNGDGTFQSQVTYPMANFPYGVATADFNGDGYPDQAISNFGSDEMSILLSQVTQTATATKSVVIGGSSTDMHNVEASYPGDTNFTGSVSATTPLTGGGTPVTGAESATTLSVTPAAATFGQSVVFSVQVVGTEQVTPVPSGTVTLMNTAVSPATMLGTITLNAGGTGSFSTTTLAVGSYNVVASYGGDTNYQASMSAVGTLVVSTGAAATIGGVAPTGVVAGSAATTITLTGANFRATDVVDLNGAALTTTYVNATTVTAVIPAAALATAGTDLVTVADPASGEVSGATNFVVAVAPDVVFTGPSTSTSGQQPAITFQLVQPYTVDISGTVTLSFTPLGTAGIDDPAVQFSSGGRTINFTIPANSTTTPPVMFQTGTVEGTATVTLTVDSDGVDVTPVSVTPVVVTLPAAVPSISTTAMTLTSDGVTVALHGFSNTREVKTATFHFTPVAGTTLSNPDVTIDVTGIFGTWYSSTTSTQYGSTFTYTQPFTLNADPKTIQSVMVTLTNSVGASTEETAQ